jgi:hypothetical protein
MCVESSPGLSISLTSPQWFHDRRIYLDALETQLKALLKATDAVVIQRKGLAEACGDFSASLHSLSAVELSPSLSGPLDSLSDIQIRIRELYERQVSTFDQVAKLFRVVFYPEFPGNLSSASFKLLTSLPPIRRIL